MLKFTFAVQKMKAGDMGRAKGHNCRTHPTKSQLPKRAWFTKAGHHTITEWDDEKVSAAKQLSKRKDAVVGIDIVIQVGNQLDWRDPPTKDYPEGKPKATKPADLNALARAGKAWLEAEFGADNVVSIEIHTDESTPHLQAVVVPRKDGKLQAKTWMHGPAKLAQLRARAHKVVNRLIPCEYDKGAPGGKPHDPSKAAGSEPPPSLMDRLTGWKALKTENAALRARVQQLEQAQFARKKASFRAAADAEATKRAEAAEAARDKALRDAAEAAKERDSAIQLGATLAAELDLFTPSERTKAKERRAEQKREQERLAEQERQAEQQRQERARLHQERQNRVDQLPHLAKTGSGALATFASRARAAITAHGGDWRGVDWRSVEQDSLREAITRNGQSPKQAIAAVLSHSPGAVAPDELERRARELEATVGRLRPSHGPSADRGFTPG